MSTRKRAASDRVVDAPEENGSLEESPAPGPVTASTSRRASADSWVRIGAGVKLTLGVLVVLTLSSLVAWGSHRYALTSPRFAVESIQVDGASRRSDEALRELAGLDLGQNVFSVDTGSAEIRLLRDPWIQQARITRDLPNSLRIEVTEREAEALAQIAAELFLVTASGLPFKRLESGDPHDLPVITGVSPANMARDTERELERIATAIEILRQYHRIELSRVQPVQEVHVGAGGEVILTVGKSAIALHLGQGGWRKKLLMAARVVGKLARDGQVPGIVFLDNAAHPERVVVRMR